MCGSAVNRRHCKHEFVLCCGSAYFPPEMAEFELSKNQVELVIASEQFEMWQFGLLLLQVAAPATGTTARPPTVVGFEKEGSNLKWQ